MAKTADELVQFFQDAGFQLTPTGSDRWHLRFAHPQMPDRAINEEVTLQGLRELYATIEQSYNKFLKQK